MSSSPCPPDKIIYDVKRGEYICTETGEVIEDRIIDQGPEWRAYDSQQQYARSRASPVNPLYLDSGIGTYSGSIRLTKKTLLIRVMSINARVYSIYKKILLYASQFNLPQHVVQDAINVLKNKNINFGKWSNDNVAQAILYLVARKYGYQLAYQLSGDIPFKLLSLLSRYIDTRYNPVRLVPSILEKIKQSYALTDAEYIDMYKFVTANMKEVDTLHSYILALVLIWLKLHNKEESLAHFAKIVDKTEVSIRGAIKKYISIAVYCNKCNYLLYQYPNKELKYSGLLTMVGIASLYGGYCPQCKTQLTFDSVKISIK